MEKIVYVLWKKEDATITDFKNDILHKVSKEILKLGALKLSVSIDDERVKPASALRQVNNVLPISGIISLWLDTALNRGPIESVVSKVTDSYAAYLVVESVPIVNTTQKVSSGQPTPGMSQVAFLKKPENLSHDDWLKLWQEDHTQVGIETQSTFQYIQNVVVRPLTEDAPEWTGIVEEGFPKEAMTDQMVFFNAAGDQKKFEAHLTRMMDSVFRFLDINQLNVIPMSEYVIK